MRSSKENTKRSEEKDRIQRLTDMKELAKKILTKETEKKWLAG